MTGLPLAPTPLLGRNNEVALAVTRLRPCGPEAVRLLTLTGPAGVGKTRLAWQVAAELQDDYGGRVYYAGLAALEDASLVLALAAQVLGLAPGGARPLLDEVKAALRDQATLLVLDNFEHVLGAAPLVAELLGGCPALKILVTSRLPLRLRAEHELAVPPLRLPDLRSESTVEALTRNPAVALFARQAQAAQADFRLDASNAPAVAEIAVLLDGLPLAIELAAARVKLFTPNGLLARLRQPSASLKLLSAGARDLPSRQQSLQSAIVWSYDLLSAEQQHLFRWLSVFVGGATLEALEAVCRGLPPFSLPDALTALVDHGLVRSVAPAPDSDGRRFRMLHVIREFAAERLEASGERPAAQRALANYLVALVEQAAAHTGGAQQVAWLDRLDDERDNLRAVLGWAVDLGQAEIGLRLAAGLGFYWGMRGQVREGLSWFDALVALRGEVPAGLRLAVLTKATILASDSGNLMAARAYAEEAQALAREQRDDRSLVVILSRLGIHAWEQRDLAAASDFMEESLRLSRELDMRPEIALALDFLAMIAAEAGDYELAEQRLEECLAISRQLNDLLRIGSALDTQAMIALARGAYRQALAPLQEALGLCRELGFPAGIRQTLTNLGFACLAQGDVPIAQTQFAEALRLNVECGSQEGTARILEGLAAVAGANGLARHAARFYGAADAVRTAESTQPPAFEKSLHARVLAEAQATLGAPTFAAATAAGQHAAQHMDRLLADALALNLQPTRNGHRQARPAVRLTTREAEVLRLVAEGLSDAAVAEKLVISPRTVNAHLTSIYSKLGVKSRAAATRYALEHSLA
jgi:predicted ATPase/DNA-binding CsgD family transcriptional regulator